MNEAKLIMHSNTYGIFVNIMMILLYLLVNGQAVAIATIVLLIPLVAIRFKNASEIKFSVTRARLRLFFATLLIGTSSFAWYMDHIKNSDLSFGILPAFGFVLTSIVIWALPLIIATNFQMTAFYVGSISRTQFADTTNLLRNYSKCFTNIGDLSFMKNLAVHSLAILCDIKESVWDMIENVINYFICRLQSLVIAVNSISITLYT